MQSERAYQRSYSIIVDGTDWNNLISELVTLKATLALPLDLALPIAKSERPHFAVKMRGAV